MSARALLATPPAIVVGFYIVAIGLPMFLETALPGAMPAPVRAWLDWAFWICAVAYAFALFTVANGVRGTGLGVIGKLMFGVTLALFVVSVVIQTWLGPPMQWFNSPLIAVFALTVWCAAFSLGFAASALDKFEGGSGLPLKDSPMWWTCFAMLFLPIGIWFLRGRIEKLLARTDFPE